MAGKGAGSEVPLEADRGPDSMKPGLPSNRAWGASNDKSSVRAIYSARAFPDQGGKSQWRHRFGYAPLLAENTGPRPPLSRISMSSPDWPSRRNSPCEADTGTSACLVQPSGGSQSGSSAHRNTAISSRAFRPTRERRSSVISAGPDFATSVTVSPSRARASSIHRPPGTRTSPRVPTESRPPDFRVCSRRN